MTLNLYLGVVDIPYAGPAEVGKKRKRKSTAATLTTADVAHILEAKYHIFATFAKMHASDTILPAIAKSVQGTMVNLMLGAPASANPFASACSTIDAAFKGFIDSEEMAGMPGVPTAAALAGVNHSFKHPYAKDNPRRASFVDTGLYRDSEISWVD